MPDVHIAVRTNIIADLTMALNIGECSDLQILARLGELANSHAMTCHQTVAKRGTGIENAVRANPGTRSNKQRQSFCKLRRASNLAITFNLGVVADNHIVMNDAERTYYSDFNLGVGIRFLDYQILEVNEIFRDLGTLVHEQQGMLDNIESNIESTVQRTHDAEKELTQANRSQKKLRAKMCCLLIFLAVISLIVVVVILSI